MPSHPTHAAIEARFRRLIDDAGLAPPDAVEHEEAAVVLIWQEQKLAVVIDLDEDGEPIAVDTA